MRSRGYGFSGGFVMSCFSRHIGTAGGRLLGCECGCFVSLLAGSGHCTGRSVSTLVTIVGALLPGSGRSCPRMTRGTVRILVSLVGEIGCGVPRTASLV